MKAPPRCRARGPGAVRCGMAGRPVRPALRIPSVLPLLLLACRPPADVRVVGTTDLGPLEQAAVISNRIAPEHLQLALKESEAMLPRIRHAGAIFVGPHSSEALGDYVAGPSHVLPTSTTARFSSPLGVYDFQKRSSLIMCSAEGASTLGNSAALLAHGEGLTAHARSAEFRIAAKEDE